MMKAEKQLSTKINGHQALVLLISPAFSFYLLLVIIFTNQTRLIHLRLLTKPVDLVTFSPKRTHCNSNLITSPYNEPSRLLIFFYLRSIDNKQIQNIS